MIPHLQNSCVYNPHSISIYNFSLIPQTSSKLNLSLRICPGSEACWGRCWGNVDLIDMELLVSSWFWPLCFIMGFSLQYSSILRLWEDPCTWGMPNQSCSVDGGCQSDSNICWNPGASWSETTNLDFWTSTAITLPDCCHVRYRRTHWIWFRRCWAV